MLGFISLFSIIVSVLSVYLWEQEMLKGAQGQFNNGCSENVSYRIASYPDVLFLIVIYCIVMYCNVSYCIVSYCIVSYLTESYGIVL